MNAPNTSEAPGDGPIASWLAFWFAPIDPVGLHRLRLFACILFLVWLVPLAGHVEAFFGLGGWFDRQALQEAAQLAAQYGETPPVPVWSVLYLCGTSSVAVQAVYAVTLLVVVLFGLGLWPRLTSVLTYVLVTSFAGPPAAPYDADALMILFAFYLMLGYGLMGVLQPGQSWARRLLGLRSVRLWARSTPGAPGDESIAANVALRLAQIHLAIVLVASGLNKLQYVEWWTGHAYWYPLHKPLETTAESLRVYRGNLESYLGWLGVAAYATLAWQIAFPLFAWRRGLARIVLLGGAAAALVGNVFVLDQPLFGPILVVGCLSYLTVGEWRRLGDLLARLPGLQRLAQQSPSSGGKRTKEIQTVASGRQR